MSRARKKINLQAKSGLAKLMAVENLNVIHDPNAKTASFDLRDRVVTLPVLKQMTGYIYDAFIAHEISHALYTPYNELQDVMKKDKIPHEYINVTEDARIEKLIKRKYPGTVKDFYKFYNDLSSPQRDFFGLKKLGQNPVTGQDLTVADLGLIDRINLHFKIGHFHKIPFSKQEEKFVTMVENEETFQDAVDVAKEIYDYMKKNGQAQEVKIRFDQHGQKQDNDQDGSGQNTDEQSGDSSDENTITVSIDTSDDGSNGEDQQDQNSSKDEDGDDKNDKDKSDDNQDGSDDGDDDGDGKSGDQDQQNQMKIKPKQQQASQSDDNTKTVTIKVGHTQANFDQEKSKLNEKASRYDIAFGDVADATESYKSKIKSIEYIEKKMSPSLGYISKAEEPYKKFLKEITPTINMMVNQFNMRKSAKDYQKMQIAKSGVLDMDSISLYQIQDDIFRRNELIPESKNHGMVMFIDWSSSMSSFTESTFKQLIILTEFCMKVGIPFDVYGFTSMGGFWGSSDSGSKNANVKKHEIFSDQSCGLFHVLTSSMKRERYRKMCANALYCASNGDQSKIYNMGLTPMTHAAFLSEYIMKDFKRKHNVEKTAMILLSDGDPTDGMSKSGNKVIMRNPDTGQNYTFNQHEGSAFHHVFGYVRDKLNITNLIGFYVTSSMTSSLPHKLCPLPDKPFDDTKFPEEFRRNKYVTLPKAKNFDKFFIVSVNNFQLDKNNYLDKIDENTSSNAVSQALSKQLEKTKKSMIFMKLFIQEIS